jgi:hypothetical protein
MRKRGVYISLSEKSNTPLSSFSPEAKSFFCRLSARACGRDNKGHISTGGGIHFCHLFPTEPPQRRHLFSVTVEKAAKRFFRQPERKRSVYVNLNGFT